MNSQRSDGSSCVMDDKIYMVGGFNGQECLQSAEIYDPVTDTWEFIQPMRNRRSGVGACALNGNIYAIGGFNGVARMLSGERYSPVTNQWTAIKDMLNPRSNYAVQVYICSPRRDTSINRYWAPMPQFWWRSFL